MPSAPKPGLSKVNYQSEAADWTEGRAVGRSQGLLVVHRWCEACPALPWMSPPATRLEAPVPEVLQPVVV